MHRTVSLSIVCLCMALMIWVPLDVNAQEEARRIEFNDVPIRTVVTALADASQTSVAFDVDYRGDELISITEDHGVPREVLSQVLEREGLYVVEVGRVILVGKDTNRNRILYAQRRIEACKIRYDDGALVNVDFHRTSVPIMLRSLAEVLSLEAVFEGDLGADKKPYDLTLREVTRAEAIRIVCLMAHVSVREEEHRLIFTPVKVVMRRQ